MLREILLAGTGGFAGSALRYCVSILLPVSDGGFPTGTFTANALGSLLIGVLMSICRGSGWYFLCVTGFCGGFTTFSTFSAETLAMLRAGERGAAAGYAVLSVATCVVCVWIGAATVQRCLTGMES